MKPVTPIVPGLDLHVTIIAKDQNEYRQLPAFIDDAGIVLSRWRLDWKERLKILWTGNLYLDVQTDGRYIQPLRLSVNPPKIEDK